MDVEGLEKRLQLLLERNRRATFKKWIFRDGQNCSANKMAEAGFFFCGSEKDRDVAQCFLCEKSLDGWEESDDPWNEHINHSSECLFAQLRQPEGALLLSQMIDIKNDLITRFFTKCLKSDLEFCVTNGSAFKKMFK